MKHARHGRSAAIAMAMAATLAGVGSARGALALFEFEGTIDSVEITYEGETFDLAVGDPVSYSYLIDLETPDLNNSSFQGAYEILASSITIDGRTGHAGDPEFLRTWALDPDDNFRTLGFGYFRDDNALLDVAGQGSLDSDAIPVGFDLDDFPIRTLGYGMSFGDEGFIAFIAVIDWYTMTIVPAPGAFLVMGLLPFRGARRRRF